MGGTPKRMENFAYYIMKEIGHKLPAGTTLLDITKNSYRYSMYKVGPVLSISVSSSIRFFLLTRNIFLLLILWNKNFISLSINQVSSSKKVKRSDWVL